MSIRRRSAIASALLIAFALATVYFVSYAAAPLLQGSLEISDEWCEFKLDYEGDGGGNETFDPAGGNFLPQETAVVRECNFAVTTPVKATIQFDAELDVWRGNVRATEEPSSRKIVEAPSISATASVSWSFHPRPHPFPGKELAVGWLGL